MNPLSPFAYYRRHRARVTMLAALMAAAVTAVLLFIGLAQEIYIAPAYVINRYLDRLSLVEPDETPALSPDTASRIQAFPEVAAVLLESNVRVKVPNAGGAYFPFRLLGVRESDMTAVLERCGVSLVEGSLPEPGSNGVALSREILRSLNLRMGDIFDRTRDTRLYISIKTPLRVTGVLSGDVRLGLMSYQFASGNEGAENNPDSGLIVLSRPGCELAVADFLLRDIKDARTKTYTYLSKYEQVARDQRMLFVLGVPIVLMVALAVLLVIGVINRLAFARRLPEFGVLYAVGRSKGWLARRLTLETAVPALLGWLAGMALSSGIMAALSAAVYEPGGFALRIVVPAAIPFAAIIPLALILYSFSASLRALGRADVVSIIERGAGGRPPHRTRSRGPRKPLSSMTFFVRHMRQTIPLVAVIAVMVVCTALIVFIFTAGSDSLAPGLNNLSRISAVSPNRVPVDKETLDRISAHPAVERVIPLFDFSPLKIAIPPMFPDYPIQTYCISADDMVYLTELYGLRMADGRLPRPNTNEIVLPWTVAKNRKIKVGVVIGSRDHPIYQDAPTLPVELVVSGIFAPSRVPQDETWFSFMSREFVEPLHISELSYIVAPRAGQKEALDAWLQSDISGPDNFIHTISAQRSLTHKEMRTMLFTFALMEILIGVTGVLVILGLVYTFLAGRKGELGTLNALGFTRRELARRVMRENALSAGVAWLSGMLACFCVLLYLQQGVYDSIGLRLDFLNPVSWLCTLPLPLAALLVSIITAGRVLSGVDPLAIIERR